MKSILKLIIVALLIIVSGCSSSVMVNDGVPRTETGDAIVGVYDDISTQTHAENSVFAGRGYLISGQTTLGVGASIYLLGCTQDKAVHFEDFILKFSATPFDVHFYEEPTITSNGTQIQGFNLDRNKRDINSSLLTYANPTFTNNGTLIFHTAAYGGNNLVGSTDIPTEIILRINTCYLFEITNNDGNNVETTYNLIWHESENNYSIYQ